MENHDAGHDNGDDVHETCCCEEAIKHVAKTKRGLAYMAGRSKSCQYPHSYYNTLVPHLGRYLLKDR